MPRNNPHPGKGHCSQKGRDQRAKHEPTNSNERGGRATGGEFRGKGEYSQGDQQLYKDAQCCMK